MVVCEWDVGVGDEAKVAALLWDILRISSAEK